jgi:hypothetical protein
VQVARRIRERLTLGDLSLLGTNTETFEMYAPRWLKDGEAGRKVSTHRFYTFNLGLYNRPDAHESSDRIDHARRLPRSARGGAEVKA